MSASISRSPDLLQPPSGWAGPPLPRLAAPPVAAHGLFFRLVSTASSLFGRQQLPDIFLALHQNRRLFWAWLFFASRLMPFGRLPAPLREKIILRTAWNCRSRYEWGQHVDIALSVGVTDAEVVAVAQGGEAIADAGERALMQACDDIFRQKFVSDSVWRVLEHRYDEAMLIEIVMLIGHYEMVASFLNSAGLVLEAPIEEKLQEFHRRIMPLLD